MLGFRMTLDFLFWSVFKLSSIKGQVISFLIFLGTSNTKAMSGVLQKRIIIFNAKRKLKQWREPHFKADFIIITTTSQMSELSYSDS